MNKRKLLSRLIGIAFVAAFSLTSCNLPVKPVTTVNVTATQVAAASPIAPTATLPPAPAATVPSAPAATAPSAPTATGTVAPTATSAATATTQLTAQVIPSINAYCRKGPGSGYYSVTSLQQGTAYNVIGRNSLNTWWLVQAPGNVTCWMGDPGATQQGPVDQASITLVQPLPATPATFVDSAKCNTKLHTLTVALNWSVEANVTGYHIYRNGTQIADIVPTTTAYGDNPAPLKTNLVYALEAYNVYGVAPQFSVTVPACD